jgi:lipoprotein-anchoring transpeptidase ErfK/SrfK
MKTAIIAAASVIVAVAVLLSAGNLAHAEILISIDTAAQRMTVIIDGTKRWIWPVSTGRPGYLTPKGTYTAFRMERQHFSKEWDDAPMPHSIFFTKRGHAIHGSHETKQLGTPVSHGCVRLNPTNAAKLYRLVESRGVNSATVVVDANEQARSR